MDPHLTHRIVFHRKHVPRKTAGSFVHIRGANMKTSIFTCLSATIITGAVLTFTAPARRSRPSRRHRQQQRPTSRKLRPAQPSLMLPSLMLQRPGAMKRRRRERKRARPRPTNAPPLSRPPRHARPSETMWSGMEGSACCRKGRKGSDLAQILERLQHEAQGKDDLRIAIVIHTRAHRPQNSELTNSDPTREP